MRLSLTPKAVPIRERLRELGEEMSREAFAGMDDEQLESMRAALARVRDNIARRGADEAKRDVGHATIEP